MAEEKDIFSEVFGEDPEEKAALERQKQKQAEKQKVKASEAAVPGHSANESLVPDAESQKAGTENQSETVAPKSTGSESGSEPAKKKRPYKKRNPEERQKQITEPLVEGEEQRKAIKKIVLEKAQQAIKSVQSLGTRKKEEKPGRVNSEKSPGNQNEAEKEFSEEGTENEKESDTVENETGSFPENPDNEVHDYLENEVFEEINDDVLKEEGTREEGVRQGESIGKTTGKKEPHQTVLPNSHEVPLKFLEDAKKQLVFIGRKKSVFGKYGDQAALYIGKVDEEGSGANEKKVCLDSLNPHVVFVCGARGSGKCLTGDTLITLDNGSVVPIKELENRVGKVLGLEHSLKVQPLHREGFYRRTVDRILKVRLRSGKEIKLTPEHPLLTVEGWRPAESLEAGNRIATPRTLPAFGTSEARECEVKLLAYLIAEGHLSNQFVLFSNTDPVIQQEFFQSIEQFHPNLQIKEHSKPDCFRVIQKKKEVDISHTVRNKAGQFTSDGFVIAQKSPVAKWLVSLGLYDKLSGEKFIPDSVLQAKKGQLSAFLNRLFSCDGSIYRINNHRRNWCISYASSSETLIRQVQHLLLRFGVLSTLREKTIRRDGKVFDAFELVVYGENVLRFITEIGFFGAKQPKQETAFQEMQELNRNPNTDTIPKEIWNDFRVSNWAAAGREYGYANPKSFHSARAYAPSREKLLRLAQIEQNAGIELLAQADIFWDEIEEIAEQLGETEVFDISVPTHHNFVANDIIVHNSYVLGVIAEELAWKNPQVGTIVVDPVGVFWSMRLPNRDEKEVGLLGQYDLLPQGLNNLKVFVPRGIAGQVPKSTYDAAFSMQPSLLTVEDWCLTFGMDRFSPTGLLLEKAMVKVREGFRNIAGKTVPGKKEKFSLDELIACLETDGELNSREKGYKQDSIRALVSRFEAAKSWGIFDEKGTPLSALSKEGQLTILDTSFLEDNVTALVIGILARRVLAARKVSTRKEAAQRLKTQSMDELLELEIPPTWLFIDEAHTLIPSGNVKTPATTALVEYVKQGRRPGCSLVFATQQPAAIDSRVLSQLDILISHKLVFDDDIKAVYKRIPTVIPNRFKVASFIKTLPVGVGLTADRREETSRAFVLKIRPRMSQHEGRDTETVSQSEPLKPEQVEKLAVEMIWGKLEKEGEVDLDIAREAVSAMNLKYQSKGQLEKVLPGLTKKGALVAENAIFIPGRKTLAVEPEDLSGTLEEEGIGVEEAAAETEEKPKEKKAIPVVTESEAMPGIELVSFPTRITAKQAERIADSKRQKKSLGMFGQEELVRSVQLFHEPIYRVKLDVMVHKGVFVSKTVFLSAVSGEFVHFIGNRFVESNGISKVWRLPDEAAKVLRSLNRQKMGIRQLAQVTGESEEKTRKALNELLEEKLVERALNGKEESFFVSTKADIPKDPMHKLLDSLEKAPFEKSEAVAVCERSFEKKAVPGLAQKLFPSCLTKKVEEVYRPFYRVEIEKGETVRTIRIDAFNGNVF
jgi:intein/homing endonuclease